MGDIEIMVLDEERLENNVGYGNIKERAPEGALWFFVLLHYFFTASRSTYSGITYHRLSSFRMFHGQVKENHQHIYDYHWLNRSQHRQEHLF